MNDLIRRLASPERSTQNLVPRRSIGEHGIVGNMDTAALVALDGTIDFLCWPHLDSPSIFASLLDPEDGGEFTLAPVLDQPHTIQTYVPGTNVLMTQWLAEEGSAEIVDLMPHPDAVGVLQNCVIRRVRPTREAVRFRLCCTPRFDYARIRSSASAQGKVVAFEAKGHRLYLHASVNLAAQGGSAIADFIVDKGATAWFVLTENPEAPSADAVTQTLSRTTAAWRAWSERSTYRGRWRESVQRSALALKLLTSHEHGSVAAAATFGLPEDEGGSRNWDYRASWIRDASFTVYAFMRLGYSQETNSFRAWARDRVEATAEGGRLRIMYAIDGSEAAREEKLAHFAGYAGSSPVRIGNGAHTQTQLDVYGELLDSAYLTNKYGTAFSHQEWGHVVEIVEHVREHWREPDAGIWEIRGEPREYLHSRVMCWVALDRAIRLARKRSFPAPIVEWTSARDEISADVWANFRHPEHGYFVREKGGTSLDGAMLMLPLVRFVSASDPVWLATLDAIAADLTDDALIFRYLDDDGLEGTEGAFTTCSFWFVECLARAGRLDQAQIVMEKALAFANHLGLYSEELSIRGEPLGNFPQALTHLSFISAAYFLDRAMANPESQEWRP